MQKFTQEQNRNKVHLIGSAVYWSSISTIVFAHEVERIMYIGFDQRKVGVLFSNGVASSYNWSGYDGLDKCK